MDKEVKIKPIILVTTCHKCTSKLCNKRNSSSRLERSNQTLMQVGSFKNSKSPHRMKRCKRGWNLWIALRPWRRTRFHCWASWWAQRSTFSWSHRISMRVKRTSRAKELRLSWMWTLSASPKLGSYKVLSTFKLQTPRIKTLTLSNLVLISPEIKTRAMNLLPLSSSNNSKRRPNLKLKNRPRVSSTFKSGCSIIITNKSLSSKKHRCLSTSSRISSKVKDNSPKNSKRS